MKKKYYWKVVHIQPDGKMVSAIIRHGKYCIEYRLGEISEESVKNNGVLVFNTRQRARDFKRNEEDNIVDMAIMKVESVGIERDPIFYMISHLEAGNKIASMTKFPEGTLAFSKVKVIERVR